VGCVTGRASDQYKAGSWFGGGDKLTGALHVLNHQLSPPHPSSLTPIKEWTHSTWKMANEKNREVLRLQVQMAETDGGTATLHSTALQTRLYNNVSESSQ